MRSRFAVGTVRQFARRGLAVAVLLASRPASHHGVLTDEGREYVEFGRERRPARARNANPGPRSAPFITLLDLNEASVLQHRQVPGQIAWRQVERIAQVAEFRSIGLGGDRQDAEPVPLVHGLVDPAGRMVDHTAGLVAADPTSSEGPAGRGRLRRCTTQAPAPDSKSTRAGSTTFGRPAAAGLRFQPSR